MEIAGYLGAFVMGLLLGSIGGGGSILTVPILVYLFGVEPVTATAYSLFIVGTTALLGCARHVRLGNLDRHIALLFGIPSVIAVIVTRKYLVDTIPDPLIATQDLHLSRGEGLLLLFALLMLLAARRMLRSIDLDRISAEHVPAVKQPLLAVGGALTGMVVSLVGAGGGFLIVPALTVFARLPMARAVGTSLFIIAANGLIGAAIDPRMQKAVAWPFLLAVIGLSVIGTLIGAGLVNRVPNDRLRRLFGWLVLTIGIWIILKETVLR